MASLRCESTYDAPGPFCFGMLSHNLTRRRHVQLLCASAYELWDEFYLWIVSRSPAHCTPFPAGKHEMHTELILLLLYYYYYYCSTALCSPWPLFSIWSYTQSVAPLRRGIRSSHGLYLHTEQHKLTINLHWHPCLNWDSNPRTQCLREGR
jgi:hypothetical protein